MTAKFGVLLRVLGVKKCTQNDFVYGELGRMNWQYVRYLIIIKYWVKILHANDNKYVKKCITCKHMTLKVILIRKNGVHFCMVNYVPLVLMMHCYFKILVTVYCFVTC